MSKCQVIPLQRKVQAKHAEVNITSFSAMLADGVAGVLPEQRLARIYAFHRPEQSGVHDVSSIVKNDLPV